MARYRGFVSAEKILSELGAEATAAQDESSGEMEESRRYLIWIRF